MRWCNEQRVAKLERYAVPLPDLKRQSRVHPTRESQDAVVVVTSHPDAVVARCHFLDGVGAVVDGTDHASDDDACSSAWSRTRGHGKRVRREGSVVHYISNVENRAARCDSSCAALSGVRNASGTGYYKASRCQRDVEASRSSQACIRSQGVSVTSRVD